MTTPEADDPNRHIREYLRYYLRLTSPPGYAVMIRGPWGIGKTFLIRQILADLFDDEKEYIYVSLYGVDAPSEIDTAIFAATHPILGSKTAKVVGRALNAGLKFQGIENPITLQDFERRTTGAIYVFDDIERSSMSSDAIFGYINQFVEHSGCRVVLVANEAELENSDGYRRKREKLVGQTLEAKSAVRGALAAFLADVANDEARDHLKSVENHIVELYEQGEVNNLRVLKQTLWGFERLYQAIEHHHRQHARAMLHILHLLFALSFEIKLGRLDAAQIRGRKDHWIAAMVDRNNDAPIKSSFDRYKGVDLSDTTLSDELLIELLVNGVIDESLIKRDLDASSWFYEPADEPSWRTIWHRFERDDGAVVEAIGTLQRELANFQYREPGEILHIFGMMLIMTEINLLEGDRESVIESARTYIVALRERGELPPLNPNSFMERIRNGSWGGLGFADAGSHHFGQIYDFLDEQRQLARIERLPALAERLMSELGEDPDLFCRRLVGHGGEGSDLIEGPVLSEIKPADFLAAVLQQPAQVECQVFQCLASRYKHRAFVRGLENELLWAKSLRDAMLKLAEGSDPVRRNKLTIFAEWFGQHIPDDSAEADGASGFP
ncbi:MAG: P-loop NTPase fold protein [Polymorphobacter sp.]|uniref:P-loop NTPase fold protein n=1 Tax=Polymorphobacter sp. TaxID=1909290 RepID=UPI003A89B46B